MNIKSKQEIEKPYEKEAGMINLLSLSKGMIDFIFYSSIFSYFPIHIINMYIAKIDFTYKT